jgi:hypothetical protein
MQLKHFLTAALLCVALARVDTVRADTVMYDSVGFIQGNQSFVDTLNITTPGTLTITLSDVPWLDAISNLSLFLTSASGTFGPAMNGGSESLKVGAGTFYAHWFGEADGQFQLGVYSLKISFQPDVSPVPLPASAILLLSGLLVMVGGRRCRKLPGRAAAI